MSSSGPNPCSTNQRGLISVNLQEHIANAQRRALAMGDYDLNTRHPAIIAKGSTVEPTHYDLHCGPVTLAAQPFAPHRWSGMAGSVRTGGGCRLF
jgi:hypothetical protein